MKRVLLRIAKTRHLPLLTEIVDNYDQKTPKGFTENVFDAIASPSTYPGRWVGQWVSGKARTKTAIPTMTFVCLRGRL